MKMWWTVLPLSMLSDKDNVTVALLLRCAMPFLWRNFAFTHVWLCPMIRNMPKKKDLRAEPTKAPKTIYLSHEVIRRLEKAAVSEGISRVFTVSEQTLKTRFKKAA